MLLQKTAKVQEMKTNVTVNIPREQREALGITGGDTVLLSADTEKQIIILKKIYKWIYPYKFNNARKARGSAI